VGLRVAIVATGHEVVRGTTPDANSPWLARASTEAGARVTSARVVGDDERDVARAIDDAVAEADAVLVTGGLGPTEDDRTRAALAVVAGVDVAFDAQAWALVEAFFRRAAQEPAPMQRRQATLPRGSTPLPNSQGTAPGVLLRVRGVDVFLLPGPPREMRAVFREEALPRLVATGRLDPTAVRVLWTAGVPESEIARSIEDVMAAPEPVVGTHPDEGEVAVRILARGADAAARGDACVAEIRRRLGAHVVSDVEDVRVQHAVVAALRERRRVVTTAESITGGLVARMLVEVPGSSDVFRGGFVTYSDEWKRDLLGVPAALLESKGAVSAEVAEAMATGALERARCDYAVSTTGVAGPGPDARGAAEGTVFIGWASRDGGRGTLPLRFAVSRIAVQRRAAVRALDLLRRRLLGLPG
jgi:nicotinamide-nucleotide amidase